jgi:tRNA(Ile)-lysidine synthase
VKVDVPLLDKVRHFLAAHLPLAGGVVVAVSGGPDSIALLRALVALRVGPLTIAHLNHQLRGQESDEDEQFVRDVHARLATEVKDLGLHCARLDIAAAARKEHDNRENRARHLRYEWLAQVARAVGSPWIATGHTADDQAETVLHRLLRGTGLPGLRGIALRRRLAPDVEVVRPLLMVPRSEVLAYLEAEGQSFRTDSSNADRSLTRNRIRHELLPHLAERYNPAVARILARLAIQAEEICRESAELTRELLQRAERPRVDTRIILDRPALAEAARHRVRELFRLLWEREGWPAGRMSFDAWDRLAALAFEEVPAVDLPDGIRAVSRGRVLQVGPIAES